MSLKNQSSKKASQLTKTVKASPTISVQLTTGSFGVLNESIAKHNHFNTEAQKANKEMNDNLVIAIEGAGLNVSDFSNVALNAETKELILTKK